jgi:hypothetical protein
MGLTMPDPLQVHQFQTELLKTRKRLVLKLSPDNQELLELHVFGEKEGFSVELRGANGHKFVTLTERL